MSVTINPGVALDAHLVDSGETRNASLWEKNSGRLMDGGISVKASLDDLLGGNTPKGYRIFDVVGDHEFIVPDRVNCVLALVISAGQSTVASGQMGGVMVSRYCDVTPGDTIAVKVGNYQAKGAAATDAIISSAFGTYLRAFKGGQYYVDGVLYKYLAATSVFPPDAAKNAHLQCCVTFAAYISTTGSAGPGMGGFAIPEDTEDVREAWLEVARDTPIERSVARRCCYPDSSVCGTAASKDYYYAGNGAGYGGVAGRPKNGAGYASYAGLGTQGFVAVFWGDDIGGPRYDWAAPAFYRKDDDSTLTPVALLSDAGCVSYTNGSVSLDDSTVRGALAELRRRKGA